MNKLRNKKEIKKTLRLSEMASVKHMQIKSIAEFPLAQIFFKKEKDRL
jgi:hypothetical protein